MTSYPEEMFYRAIETRYDGYHFRSRQEARWAVFMNSLGVRYVYERQGYDLGSNGFYLPDFWIPHQDCWLEIKPNADFPVEQARKMMALASFTKKVVFVLFDCVEVYHSDPIEERKHIRGMSNNIYANQGMYYAPNGEVDHNIEFGYCELCEESWIGRFGWHFLELEKQKYNFNSGCYPCNNMSFTDVMTGKVRTLTHPHSHLFITQAFEDAKSERF